MSITGLEGRVLDLVTLPQKLRLLQVPFSNFDPDDLLNATVGQVQRWPCRCRIEGDAYNPVFPPSPCGLIVTHKCCGAMVGWRQIEQGLEIRWIWPPRVGRLGPTWSLEAPNWVTCASPAVMSARRERGYNAPNFGNVLAV